MTTITIINGPNLNLLGARQRSIYGSKSLAEINSYLTETFKETHDLRFFQSNHEGALIDYIHEAQSYAQGIIINAGAYTHSSIAIRDAISSITIPVIEVHLSNIFAREEFRQISMLAGVCTGQICGFGEQSYHLAVLAINTILRSDTK